LDVIDDLADIKPRIVGVDVEAMARGRFDDCFIMPRPDGCLNVRAKQRNDAVLIFCGYSAR
jgi:hypothetical protein